MQGLPSLGGPSDHTSKIYVLGSKKAEYRTLSGEKIIEITDYAKERVFTIYPNDKVYTEKNLYLSPEEFKRLNKDLNHRGSYVDSPKDATFEISGRFTGESSSAEGMKCKTVEWTQKIKSPSEPKLDKELNSTLKICKPVPPEYLNYKKNLTSFSIKYFENWKASGVPFPLNLNSDLGGFDQNSKLAKMQIVPMKRNIPEDVREWIDDGFQIYSLMKMTVPTKMTMVTSISKVSTAPFAESYVQIPSQFKKVDHHTMSPAQMSKMMEQFKQMDPEKMKALMKQMRPPGN